MKISPHVEAVFWTQFDLASGGSGGKNVFFKSALLFNAEKKTGGKGQIKISRTISIAEASADVSRAI